jgi:hypothetical protein
LSANPAAFDLLRDRAYKFAAKNGKDAGALGEFCYAQIEEWRAADPEGSDLSECEGKHIAQAVATWVATKYKPRRKAAKTTRAQRDADKSLVTLVLETLEEIGERQSARNVAAFAGYSKSKAARLMKDAGIAPRHDAKVGDMSAPAQRLYRILEWNTPAFRPIAIPVDHLIRYVWPPHPVVPIKKSARSMQRKRFESLIREISKARLGFQILTDQNVAVVRSDRRWKRLNEAALYLDDAIRHGWIHAPHIPPVPEAPDVDLERLFSQRPEIQLCFSLLRMTRQRDFRRPSDAMPILKLMQDSSVHPDRILQALSRALASGNRCVDYLFKMRDFRWNEDRVFAQAIGRFAKIASEIFPTERWSYFYFAYDLLTQIFHTSGYLERLKSSDPEAAARVQHLLDTIPQGEQLEEAIVRLERCAREEVAERRKRTPAVRAAIQRAVETIPF